MKVLCVFEFSWLLKDHLKFYFFRFFCHDKNNCLQVTSLCLSTSTVQTLHTLMMGLIRLQYCKAEIVRVEKIKILAPQKLAKDCLPDVLKSY